MLNLCGFLFWVSIIEHWLLEKFGTFETCLVLGYDITNKKQIEEKTQISVEIYDFCL